MFYAAWVVVLGGMITLFVSANRRSEESRCKGLSVTISNGSDNVYTKEVDVRTAIEKGAGGPVIRKHYGQINLKGLERSLEANAWIRDAELYFDTKGVLNVQVWERLPVARVFTTGGRSFYIDSAGYPMPLLESFTAPLPVVTGFPDRRKLTMRDSAVLHGLKNIVAVVSRDPFWEAQIGQIEVTPDGLFELVPTLGSHLIRLGHGEDVEKKLAKLMVFYRQVLPKAGLAKYSVLDLQFDEQVVAVKKGPQSPVDSLQLQRNIQELMRKKATEQEAPVTWSEDSLPIAVAPVVAINPDSVKVLNTIQKQKTKAASVAATLPTPKKTTNNTSKPDEKPKALSKSAATTKPKPKAVMQPKKGESND